MTIRFSLACQVSLTHIARLDGVCRDRNIRVRQIGEISASRSRRLCPWSIEAAAFLASYKQQNIKKTQRVLEIHA
jgi:hypothetical protein